MGVESRSKWDIIRADVRLFTSQEGGRATGINSGYVCDCRVPAGKGHRLTAGAIWFEGADSIDPGQTRTAWIQPGSPERWREVAVGTEVGLCDGPVLVGMASVLEIRPIPPEARLLPSHRRSTSRRWSDQRNRRMEEDGDKEEWRRQQCGLCQYWIPLAGSWGLDWGACSNEASPFDGTVRYEHDGCDAYAEAAEWRGPQDFAEEELR